LNKHCKALELDKVLYMLSELASCEDSKNQCLQIVPSNDYFEVSKQLRLTAEANSLTSRYGTPSIGNIKNCTQALNKAKIGAMLSLREILDICYILRSSRIISSWRNQCEQNETALDYLFQNLFSNKKLEDAINDTVTIDEEILDTASAELANIRRKIVNCGANIRSTLDKMIKSSAYQKFLQEQIVTIRDGRYVVPVKAECKSEIKGLVHDVSSSGATVFIEPIAIVEANNEIRVLQGKEKQEIERIILELSNKIGEFADSISDSYNALVELDVCFAKSRLADKMHASVPNLANNCSIDFKKARHPLIDSDKIVPTDIRIGTDFDTLVITGPNTGGKTVAIKTLGLLSLMVMCGLMIPVSDGSTASVFNNVLADIGDEQSIEQSLSTFSSHMTNIVSILNNADSNTLVLLDELGAGTDPVEGAALAVAIIEKLREKKCRVAATTHYAEIKMFALQTDGVENACCEFDVATLRPTYKLLIGIPGKSNAFAISERLGLSTDIIDAAKSYVSAENKRFEDVVSELEAARQQLEKEKTEAAKYRIEIQKTQSEINEFKKKLELEKEKEIEKARNQARGIVEAVREQSEMLLEELAEIKRQKDSTEFSQLAVQAKAKYKGNIRKLQDLADPVTSSRNTEYTLPRDIKRSDVVLLTEINKEGIVLSEPDSSGYLQVQAGIIKTKVHISKIRLLDQLTKKTTYNNSSVSTKNVTGKAQRDIVTELDLRGFTVDEAVLELDKYIDNSLLSGLKLLTIIHGKGTGALRDAVHRRLKQHKSVKSFRLGVYGEGENGVTIAELY